ncbi:MAG TPA: polysaccharide biosynthesis/export family protein [Candidatus Acidoferrales bacterium]
MRFGLKIRLTLAVAFFLLIQVAQVRAQLSGPVAITPNSAPGTNDIDYKIGPGDVLGVTVAEDGAFNGKYKVSDSGFIEVTGVADPIHVEGDTAAQLAHTIKQALIDARQLRNPSVGVYVEEYHGSTITVLGAVAKPSVYPLARRTTIMEAISMAGGLALNAGNTVTVIRGPASAEASGTKEGSVEIVDLGKLVRGEDSSANAVVRRGDVVSVSTGEVVYVVGAVAKPGGFVMPDPGSGISVVQALAMAQGFSQYASTHQALIIRQSTSDTARTTIPVDLPLLMRGQETDMRLSPNDILFIPESNLKKTIKVMGDIGMALVNGVAIYGLGYHIAGIH